MGDEVEALFTRALGLQRPWVVVEVRLDVARRSIDFEVDRRGALMVCPHCGAAAKPALAPLRRSWRHLDFFQFQAWLHAEVPRVDCADCRTATQLVVPWARPGSGCTLAFEAASAAGR